MLLSIWRWLFGYKWLEIPPGDPFNSDAHGQHSIEYVSRHAIAETGLTCPFCHSEVAPLGDYRLVRRCRLGEVIRCNGARVMDGDKVPCPKYLVASPDTEHGDHDLWDITPKADRAALFYRFVKISAADAVRRKFGQDVSEKAGVLSADKDKAIEAVPYKWQTKPRLSLAVGQVWQTDEGAQATITRVQAGEDPIYKGWAWGKILNAPEFEWHIDPAGYFHQTMLDPGLKDHDRLVSEVRPL